HRQYSRCKFAGAAGNLVCEPAFREIAAADSIRVLLQVRQNLLEAPAAANIMANNTVKDVATVGSCRSSGTNDLLDLVNTVPAAVAIETVADRRSRFCRLSFAPFSPHDGPTKRLVDAGQLTDRRIKRVAGNGQRLIGAPEELRGNW